MLKIILERALGIDEEVGACFMNWKRAFDRLNWTKLMQILKETGVHWRITRSREDSEC
jgi:hypothetical protein